MRGTWRGWVCALLLLAMGAARAEGSGGVRAGTLDRSFGAGGKVTTDFLGGDEQIQALQLLPDGRLLAVGWTRRGTIRGTEDFALARYLKNGRLDPTFGEGGKVRLDFFGGEDRAAAVALLEDGRFIVAGFAFNPVTNDNDFAVVRFLKDGRLDTTFGDRGRVLTDFFDNTDLVGGMAIQPNGRIVVVGAAFNPSTSFDMAIARYLKDGRLDPSFGHGGKFTLDFSGGFDGLTPVVIQPGCRIVAAGTTFPPESLLGDFAVIRLLPDGTLDPSFGGDGRVTVDFEGDRDEAFALARYSKDRLVVVGHALLPRSFLDYGLVRLEEDGGVDESFGAAGRTTTDFFLNRDQPFGVAVQPDWRIVVAGRIFNSVTGNDDFGIARYDRHGRLDSSFGTAGRVVTDFRGGFDEASAIVLQPDGNIVVGGTAFAGETGQDFALVRYVGGKRKH